MLDSHKMQEIRAFAPVLEIEESSWPSYQKLAILRALEFFQELQEAGGLERFLHMADRAEAPAAYAMAAAPAVSVDADGGSEFMRAINGKDSAAVWEVVDDLMETLKHVYPNAYHTVMQKIGSL